MNKRKNLRKGKKDEGRKDFTAFFSIANAAIKHAARTLAARVPKGTHFSMPLSPIPRPLRRAKYHLVQTPNGPTMQANKSWAFLLAFLNSVASRALQTAQTPQRIKTSAVVTIKLLLHLSKFQMYGDFDIVVLGHLFQSHLKPVAVSIPKTMEEAARSKPAKTNEMKNKSPN